MRLCRCVIIDMHLCTSDAFSLHVLGCNLYGYERQLVVVSMKVNVGKKNSRTGPCRHFPPSRVQMKKKRQGGTSQAPYKTNATLWSMSPLQERHVKWPTMLQTPLQEHGTLSLA
jgi:hypothetical protein